MTDNCRGPILIGKAMSEVALGCRGTAHSPDSDCNSNHPGSASIVSNTSSQDIDFIQDNSDYQWFLDFGYRDASANHHTSILSLPESYEAGDIGYYDAIAKNMDANLAEADMESFRTEDIHALLTNLPPICADHQEINRQTESLSGSMAKFDFDSSMSPHSSSQGEDSANSTSMSICKSELLFSPVKETPMPGANYSVDSLDCDLLTEHDIMLTCQANKDNYTIAFEGSLTMYSEESDYHETDKSDTSGTGSMNWPNNLKAQLRHMKGVEASMAKSDSGSFTTWSKLKKLTSENQLRRHPSGNNNGSGDETSQSFTDNCFKSQSMPNLHKQRLRGLLSSTFQKSQNLSNSSVECCTIKRRPVKVFDIQHQIQSSSGSAGSEISDMASSIGCGSTSSENGKQAQQNFSLVKLYMKQKSMSAEGMSTAMDQSSASENWLPTQSGESNLSENKPMATNETTAKESFEDSLLMDNKTIASSARTYDLIAEEQEEELTHSESVEQLTESATQSESPAESFENDHHKKPCFNLNNNNSVEYEEINIKRSIRNRGTNTKRTASFSSDSGSSGYTPSDRERYPGRLPSKNVSLHLMNRSIQTSCFAEVNNLKNAPYKLNCNNDKDSYKVIQPSFLSKLKKESGEAKSPVYILYPNYVLPDLEFLQKHEDVEKMYLLPQRISNPIPKKRPFSCNDVETLKRKDYSHVKDWDSLNFLLPCEYRQILADVPEIAQHINNDPVQKPSFCISPMMRRKQRPMSCDYTERTNSLDRVTNVSSSSSTTTQPSSGYRGSSTLLTDSNSPSTNPNYNPLLIYKYDSVTSSEASVVSDRQKSITTMAPPLPKRSISLSTEQNAKIDLVPPRPPLPKGILRKSLENAQLHKQNVGSKRYSMLVGSKEDIMNDIVNKRRSLQEPYYFPRNKRLSETEDEGVDAGTSSSSLDEQNDMHYVPVNSPNLNLKETLYSNLNNEEINQLEEYLKLSGISSDDEMNEESMMQLRSYVAKFLSLKINQDHDHCSGKKCVSFAENLLPQSQEGKPYLTPNNSPNVSAFVNNNRQQVKTLVDMPICEENEINSETYSTPYQQTKFKSSSTDLSEKRALISSVTDAVEQVIHHFSPATNQNDLNTFGDSALNPACAKLVLSTLCPALYAVLSDGLKPSLETSFGAIGNSVWQVVEASAQQGPLTKALNELVMRINGEDVITEGLVKFNAFVFGLLNVRSLDAWASYLRTRESILRKHYEPNSLLVLSHTGGANVRALLDTLIASLQPLALLPFQFDLLFEYRQLHLSFKRMDSYQHPPSPTLKTTSPVNLSCKHWKVNHSGQSNLTHSSSETDEISAATTVHHFSPEHDKTLPDLLNSSGSPKANRPRPRSCVDPGVLSKPSFKLGEDVNRIANKRWSGISPSSKLFQAFNRLQQENSEEEYTDSLENPLRPKELAELANEEATICDGPESLDSNFADDKPLNGRRFKKLQKKWEMLSGRESQSPPESPTHQNKSKIPRPVASPVKPSGIPVPISTANKTAAKPPAVVKKIPTPTNENKKFPGSNLVKNSPAKKGAVTRTSRLDQLESHGDSPRHITRPSSLPYKPVNSQSGNNKKTTPPRRAISTSVNRKPSTQNQTPKVVRTLSHRLPSESGHLSYNEGERLKVVLEVDEKWLLCCRGTQKGLVPKSAVIADNGRF